MYTFGISREYYKKVYFPEAKQVPDECVPGPGTYDSKFKTIGTSGQKWGFQGRSIILNGKFCFILDSSRTNKYKHKK
jgi:hypothetical protein